MRESNICLRAQQRASTKSTWWAGVTLLTLAAGFTGCGEDGGDPAVEGQPEDLKRRGDGGAARPCGARLGNTCAPSEFCDWTLQGICGFADATGVCKPKPQACTAIYDPVCGCDGQTYSSACSANAAGVSVQLEEPCEAEDAGADPGPSDAGGPAPVPDTGCGGPVGQLCGGFAGLPCPDGAFCNLEPAVGGLGCDIADASGVCQPVPQACTREYAPVCGCNGETYGNICMAHAAGVSVAHTGECGTNDGGVPDGGTAGICGGLLGASCDKGEFCNFEGDPSGVACGAADGTGVCEPIPDACTLEYNPVCGCDDQTYGNACAAHAAGVSVASKGECGKQGLVNCDQRDVLCRRGTPKCPGGTVPSVVGSCYGDCVPIEQCGCSEAAECPLPDEYTCHLSAGHCGPYVN